MPCTDRITAIAAAALSVALTACATAPAPPSAAQSDPPDLVIANVAAFDTGSGTLLPARDVTVKDGFITAIEMAGVSSASPGTQRIDGRGMTLLPGLINAHVHTQSSDDMEAGMEDLLRRGITSVRDLAGDTRPVAALEQRRRAGEAAVPELIHAALIAGPRHMEDPRTIAASGDYAPGNAPWMRAVTAQSDLAAVMADARATGASGIKIYASLEPGLLQAVTRAAVAEGLLVWTHSVIFPANGADVVATRPHQVIHTKGLASADDTGLPDNFFPDGITVYMANLPLSKRDPENAFYAALFADMRAHDILLEPALMADGDMALAQGRELPQHLLDLRDWSCRATGAAWRAGVTIGAGTDFSGEGDMLLRELDRLVECGVSREGALTAATWNNARALGISDRTGRIAPGYEADLLLVEGDPTRDLAALRNVRGVFSNGEEVARD